MFSLICAWMNGWVNNREAGDLRRPRTHFDVTVMLATLQEPTSRLHGYIYFTVFFLFFTSKKLLENFFHYFDFFVKIGWRNLVRTPSPSGALQWRHDRRDSVSNHQPRLFRRRSKKTSKLRVTGLCAGNSQWKHFLCYWPFVRGILQSPVVSPHKGQWRGSLMFSLICAWTNGWTNTRDGGYLRPHRARYDVTNESLSMFYLCQCYAQHLAMLCYNETQLYFIRR